MSVEELVSFVSLRGALDFARGAQTEKFNQTLVVLVCVDSSHACTAVTYQV